jgi:hypothetical protein
MAKNKKKRKKPYEWMKPGTKVYLEPFKNIIYEVVGSPIKNRGRWRVYACSETGGAKYFLLCQQLGKVVEPNEETDTRDEVSEGKESKIVESIAKEQQEPLEGVILPYHEVVVFRDLHDQWQVRCLSGGEEELEKQLGKLWFNTKKEALKAIGELE